MNEKIYEAIVWFPDQNEPGKRVTVLAIDIDEAKAKLDKQYGKGNVFDLHNKDEANKSR